MKYLCLNCSKTSTEKYEYCCNEPRVIKVDYDKPKKLQSTYEKLQEWDLCLKEYFNLLKEFYENSN